MATTSPSTQAATPNAIMRPNQRRRASSGSTRGSSRISASGGNAGRSPEMTRSPAGSLAPQNRQVVEVMLASERPQAGHWGSVLEATAALRAG